MNLLFRIVLLALTAVPQITDAQQTRLLFNQNNLDGWYAFEQEAGKLGNASELFVVENKMIRLYGAKAGYLMTNQSFHDFQLTVDFRWNTDTTIVRKSNKKNSGLMYLVPSETPDTLWPKGIQFQIKEGGTGDFILLHELTLNINGERTVPGRSVMAKRIVDATNPIGEWNTIVVRVSNGKVTQMLNGELVNEGVEPSVQEGRILLQYEGFPIDFRKVEIEIL